MKCPACKSENYVKNGFVKESGKQRFLCKDCGKSFLLEEEPNSIYLDARKRNKLIRDHLLDRKKVSLTDIMKGCNLSIHRNTLYYWRHKILSELCKRYEGVMLSGTIQADETYLPLNFKGNHNHPNGFVMPRPAKKRSSDTHIRGLSKEQVCVLTAIDDKDHHFILVIGQGMPTQTKVYDALKNHIEENSILITDSSTAYKKVVKALNLKHYQIPRNKHSINGYNIQKINNYHKYLKLFMGSFFGVSSKFLQEYIVWYDFVYRQDLTDKQKEKILQEIMSVVNLDSISIINKTDRLPKVKKERKRRKKKTS